MDMSKDVPVRHLLALGVELPELLGRLVERQLRHLVVRAALVELGLAPGHPLPRRHHLQVLPLHAGLVRVLAPVLKEERERDV